MSSPGVVLALVLAACSPPGALPPAGPRSSSPVRSAAASTAAMVSPAVFTGAHHHCNIRLNDAGVVEYY